MEWLVTVAAAGALLAGVAGSLSRAARRGASWQGKVEARWREAAELLEAPLDVKSSGSLTPKHLAIVLDADDTVAIAEVNVPVDSGAPSHTRVGARFALGKGPVFRMWERGAFDPGGSESAVFTDRALVRRVRVETHAAAATAALFSPEACAHTAAFTRALALRSDGETLELVWDGVELDPKVIASALRLLLELAQRGTGVLRGFADMDGARYVPSSEGGPLTRVRRGSVEVDVLAVPETSGPSYRVRVDTRGEMPALEVKIGEGGGLEGEMPAGLMDAESMPQLARVGPCVMRGAGEEVELLFEQAPTREQTEAAVRLLSSIGASRARRGAFR